MNKETIMKATRKGIIPVTLAAYLISGCVNTSEVKTKETSTYQTVEEKEQAYKNIEYLTDYIEKTYNTYSLNEYIYETKVITRISKCKDIYKGLEVYMNSAEMTVGYYIAAGEVDENDVRVQRFEQVVEAARIRWHEVKTELDEEQRKIDIEMGLISAETKNDYKYISLRL